MLTRLVAYACVLSHLGACTTLQPVPDVRTSSSFMAGDDVIVTTTDDREKRMLLTAVSHDSICAASDCVLRSEISSARRVQVDQYKTGNVTLGVLGILALAALSVLVVQGMKSAGAAYIWGSSH